MPAVANAVFDAVGVRVDEVPCSPHKVLRALKEKMKGREGRYGPDKVPVYAFPEAARVRTPAEGGTGREEDGRAHSEVGDYGAFLFHQANLFMLKHLVKKAKLPADKVPINIDRYGNSSSASIPLLMTTDLAPALRSSRQKLAMFGFGVGYSWASASLEVGPLGMVETIEA